MNSLYSQGAAAKAASRLLALSGTEQKNRVLEAMAQLLTARQEEWLKANAEDIAAAKASGMSASLLDRLTLTPERVSGIVSALREVAALPDPIGKTDRMETRPNGLIIGRRRVPLGVIGIIFEARPNVTVDAAALCLKSGNACILRGGSEAIHSNRAVTALIREALENSGLPADCVSLVQDTGRETAVELMHLNEFIDVLIPRGGAGLIRAVAKEASVPVIRTGEGVCHVYIDKDADLEMGAEILYNAKCSRPSVCNAAECVLIHRERAAEFLEKALPLLNRRKVELRCDPEALALLKERGRSPGWRSGGGHRIYPPTRHRPFRMYCNRQLPGRPAFSGRSGRGGGLCKRLHPLYRRRGIRPGRGDRHFNPKNARPGPHGPGGAHLLEICGLRERADQRLEAECWKRA